MSEASKEAVVEIVLPRTAHPHAAKAAREIFDLDPSLREDVCARFLTFGVARAQAAEADAKLAWRRVTELQTRCTELVLEHRRTLAVVRSERDFADAAAAGYDESARYWERRLRSLVRALEELANDADNRALTASVMLDKVDALAREFYDHDWDGSEADDGAEAKS